MAVHWIGRALSHRNFRLFFGGQSISLVGTWMQQVAMIWLVYRLSDSPFLLGLVGFCMQIPSVAISPVAGVLVDRWNRRRTLLATQSLAMLHGFLLAALTVTGLITIWQIVLLAVVLGVINAFDMPTRQAFLIDMIEDRADLGNAIALNSSMFNGARLIGPSLAGFVIAAAGEWVCFLVNAVSYVAVLVALLAMRVAPRPANGEESPLLRGLAEGLSYAFGFPPIRMILALVAIVSLASMPLAVLMPMLVAEQLHGGPDTLGMLTAASGLGALGGALLLASRKSVLGLGRLMAVMTAVLGASVIGAAYSTSLPLSLAFLMVSGLATMVQLASANTILQTIVEEDKRGRIMSLYTAAFLGMAPIGSLVAGALASHVGTPLTLGLSGAICMVGAAAFATKLPFIRTVVRPIYQRVGILPEVARPMAKPVPLVDSPDAPPLA